MSRNNEMANTPPPPTFPAFAYYDLSTNPQIDICYHFGVVMTYPSSHIKH